MYNKEMVLNILSQILEATQKISTRFNPISEVDDFTGTPEGMVILDSICMLIIAVGESLKKLDKITDGTLLSQYPQIDWKGAKGMRDIISHHYFDVDAEEIFWVCKNQIGSLSHVLQKIIADIE